MQFIIIFLQQNPMYQQRPMNGIVVEQTSPHYGALVQPNPNQSQNYFGVVSNGISVDNNEEQPLQPRPNVPVNLQDYSLLSASGYCKVGEGIAAVEVILLTTKNFAEIPIKDIKKLKVYRKSPMQAHKVLKIQTANSEKVFHLVANNCYHFSYTCFWAKLITMGIKIDMKQEFLNCCEGQVYKMSEIMKNWEPRYLLITSKDGLLSYRNKTEEPTLQVESYDEFWTRFQLIEGDKFIVFKFWHSIFKEEFAVPLYRAVKWFKAFYSLLNK